LIVKDFLYFDRLIQTNTISSKEGTIMPCNKNEEDIDDHSSVIINRLCNTVDLYQNKCSKNLIEIKEVKVIKKGAVGNKVGHDSLRSENNDFKKITEDHDGYDDNIMTKTTFQSLNVCQSLCEAVSVMKWEFATRIQKETIPPALLGRDIIGLAETGSGKTGAFLIPIIQNLLENPQCGAVHALILVPTRELAFQIHEVVNALGSYIGASSLCIVGGVDMILQSQNLMRNPHILTATPGRLVDHLINTKGFHLRKIKYLVMDEADRILSMDFEKEINQILDVIPDCTRGRKTMLFSATMTTKVQKLQRASLTNPVSVAINNKFSTPSKLLQSYLFIPSKYKDVYLTYIITEYTGNSTLVFGATCNTVQRLALMLRNLGFPAVALHGQMSQPKRLGALHKFKSSKRELLICTDVASRGLDIPSVNVVINYDLPGHGKDYIHRVGRTARAGRSGTAIAIVTQYDVELYQRLEALLGRKLPEYKLNEETVLILNERVSEAQRLAIRELKEQTSDIKRNNRYGRKSKSYQHLMDDEDPVEEMLKNELQMCYYRGGSGGFGGAMHNQRGGNKYNKRKKRKGNNTI